MRNEIRSLTTLRAVGAAMVFFYHLTEHLPLNSVLFIVQQGFVGVDIFFVLSGYILARRYFDEVQEHNFNFRRYMTRRVARIYPLYFFILILTALWLPTNITNWTLTQGFFYNYISSGIPTAWTLTVEESFYLVLPLILLSLTATRNQWNWIIILGLWTAGFAIVGVLLVSFATTSGLQAQAGFLGTPALNPIWALSYTIFGYVFDFTVGIFFALRAQRSNNLEVKSRQTILSVIAILLCMGGVGVMHGLTSGRFFVYGLALAVGFLIDSLANAQNPYGQLLSWGPLPYLGRISYALYLIQRTPLVTFMLGWNPLLFYLGTSIMSAALYEVIEKPAQQFILKIATGRKVQLSLKPVK